MIFTLSSFPNTVQYLHALCCTLRFFDISLFLDLPVILIDIFRLWFLFIWHINLRLCLSLSSVILALWMYAFWKLFVLKQILLHHTITSWLHTIWNQVFPLVFGASCLFVTCVDITSVDRPFAQPEFKTFRAIHCKHERLTNMSWEKIALSSHRDHVSIIYLFFYLATPT